MALAQQNLEYSRRTKPDRLEGQLQLERKGGLSIELVSAQIINYEVSNSLPAQLHLMFSLPRVSTAYISVRELEPYYKYAMDAEVPTSQLHAGPDNQFAWPTQDVLRSFPDIDRMERLGVVVRLKPTGHLDDTVAPAAFYYSRAPREVNGYVFKFRPTVTIRCQADIYQPNRKTALWSQVYPWLEGGHVFDVPWPPGGSPEGNYTLALHAYPIENDNSSDLFQYVHFYHDKAAHP